MRKKTKKNEKENENNIRLRTVTWIKANGCKTIESLVCLCIFILLLYSMVLLFTDALVFFQCLYMYRIEFDHKNGKPSFLASHFKYAAESTELNNNRKKKIPKGTCNMNKKKEPQTGTSFLYDFSQYTDELLYICLFVDFLLEYK